MSIRSNFRRTVGNPGDILATLLFLGFLAVALALFWLVSPWVIILPAVVIFILSVGANFGRRQAYNELKRERDTIAGTKGCGSE